MLVTAEFGISLPVGSTSSPTKNLPRARSSNLLSSYRWELPRAPKFLYTLTAGCCAQKREERREDDTTRTGVAAVIERIEYIRAEPAYREFPGSKPRAVSV